MCYTCIPFIYVDVHLKTIFAVTLALVSEDGVCCKVVFKLFKLFHNLFLPSFFSIIEVIIELFVI